MSTPAFSQNVQTMPALLLTDADFSAIPGAADDAAVTPAIYWTARKFRLVSQTIYSAVTYSADTTTEFNSGDVTTSTCLDPYQRWNAVADFFGFGAPTSPMIGIIGGSGPYNYLALTLFSSGQGQYKLCPYWELAGFSPAGGRAMIIISRVDPSPWKIDSYVQIDTVTILGVSCGVWQNQTYTPDSYSYTLDDTIANAYWLPGDFA